jgi:two-component system sensor histidine kinase CiaH
VFKKLRNRFLILNLITISVMMLMAFASIYLITYRDVYANIDMELHRISDFSRKPDKNFGKHRGDFGNPPDEIPYNNESKPERSVSFALITDKQWKITATISVFDMESEFYESAKNSVISKNKETGTFKLDRNNWAFIVNSTNDGYRIDFLDITSQQEILRNLIYTFIIVALVMLIIIFLVSRFFANRSIKPVKEAFDKQKQFIADASHELKTPLAVINTNVDVLLANGEDTIINQSKWLYYIKSESERMTRLTNDLLYLTQMDHSDMKMVFAKFNMSEAVESVILTMEGVIFEHNISLDYNIAPNLMTYGNIEQIKQVVMILLDNAIKYTITNGSVDISLKRQHNSIVLSVANSGEGIKEEHLEKIFDRFYRTDKSRARKLGGYGLGLAIAKAIIDQHKGKIYAESVVNEKTTFFVELPLVPD